MEQEVCFLPTFFFKLGVTEREKEEKNERGGTVERVVGRVEDEKEN